MKIEEFFDFFKENNLTELHVEDGMTKVDMSKDSVVDVENKRSAIETSPKKSESDNKNIVTSTAVGIYYARPEKGASTFVKLGSIVKRGDTICMIESMKNFTNVPAPFAGKVTKIFVDDKQAVEYGQKLFEIQSD